MLTSVGKFGGLAVALLATDVASEDTYEFPRGHDPYRDHRNHLTEIFLEAHITEPWPVDFFMPNVSGTYPWVEFHHGFGGTFPSGTYWEYMREIAQMGYVVTYTRPHEAHEDASSNFTIWEEANKFVKEHGSAITSQHSLEQGAGVEVHMDTTKLGFSCHANGCDITKQFANTNPSIASSYNFVDPIFEHFDVDQSVKLGSHQNVIVQTTDMCGRCCMDSTYSQRLYDSFSGMGAKTFGTLAEAGHCSMLNYFFADNCRTGRYCDMPRSTRMEVHAFHKCVAGGVVSQTTESFFIGRNDMTKYYTEAGHMCDNYLVNNQLLCEGSNC